MKPNSPHGFSHPKAGGEHEDALEHGMPHDERSQGAGPAEGGVGVKPSSSANHLERAEYPEPGEETSGGGAHNHRSLPPPSKEAASGNRGIANVRGVIGDGRGASGKFRGTMGGGEVEPKAKGVMGQ